jgi:hypothetical protein
MIRYILSMTVIGAFCLTIGAQQNPTQLAKRAESFAKNKMVITEIVDKTVLASRTPEDHLKRADSYYLVLFQFNLEIGAARTAKDEVRAKDLTTQLTTLLDQGLKPTLEQAHQQLKGGTGAERFPKIKEDLLKQLNTLVDTLPQEDKAQQSLTNVRDRLLQVGK